MTMTLSQIVSAALQQAELSDKVASAKDVRQVSLEDSFLDRELGLLAPEEAPKVASATPTPAPAASAVLEDASYGMKLAEALDRSAMVLEKRADPVVSESQHSGEAQPKPTAPAQAKGLPGGVKEQGSLAVDDEKPTTEGSTGKTAADVPAMERQLAVKVAEHEMFRSLGKIAEAEAALEAARGLKAEIAKVAAGAQGDLVLRDGLGGHFPANEAVAGLTRATARDMNTRDGASHIRTQPRKDPAVQTNIGRSEGQKISSAEGKTGLRAVIEKVSSASKEEKSDKKKVVAASAGIGAGIGGVHGHVADAVRKETAHSLDKRLAKSSPASRALSKVRSHKGALAGAGLGAGLYGVLGAAANKKGKK